MIIKVSAFVKMVPKATKEHLKGDLKQFRVLTMPWLCQLYYDDKLIHYEVVKLPPRFGDNRLEIGLHFESRDRDHNTALLEGFERYMLEVRDVLGDEWWAEPWDRGWTKIYTTHSFQTMDEDLLDEVARQLATAITVLQPIYHLVLGSIAGTKARR